jgi:2-polyprenyl-3-methyl-5-hydroxy-6-metoxy-1,4-benzoquinol methylase
MDSHWIEREKEFHNELARSNFDNRRLINRLSWGFYSKESRSPIWGPVWSQIDLPGKRVLDYGCGDGGFSFELAQRGALVDGIDISEGLVEMASCSMPRGMPKPRFSVCDAHCTSFPDASFDYIFGNGILHHLKLEEAYREIARLLKPGGKAFFMEAMEHHPLAILMRMVTPASRSVDEKPLSLEQIEMAARFFGLRHTEHYLFAVVAAPLHLLNRRLACGAIKALDQMDRVMIRFFPGLGRYAWQSMLELEKSGGTPG